MGVGLGWHVGWGLGLNGVDGAGFGEGRHQASVWLPGMAGLTRDARRVIVGWCAHVLRLDLIWNAARPKFCVHDVRKVLQSIARG